MPNSHYEKFTLTGEVKCIDDEIPFDLPKGWEWCRLGEVAISMADGPFGSNLKTEHYTEKPEVRIIQLSNIGEFGWKDSNKRYTTYKHLRLIERSSVDAGDIVIAKMMPAGRAIICPNLERKYVLSSDSVKVKPTEELNTHFLLFAINSEVFRSQVYGDVQGITRIRTSISKLKEYLIPLPPLAEQQRIVAKIEELMPLVGQYGKVQSELEALNNNIREQLKKSVLQYAIEGKLVPQCEEDGTAEDLLAEIQAEKQRLYAEGKLKKKDLVHSTIFRGEDNKYYEQIGKTCVCIDDEIPFEIPSSWRWVRMGNIANMYTGNSINKDTKDALYTNVEGFPYIATKDVGFDNNIEYSNGVSIPYNIVGDFRVAPFGTILLCIEGGSAGRKIAILNQEVCFGNKLCCLNPYKDITHYIYHYCQSFTFFSIFSENKNGIIGGVSLNGLKNLVLPLPSLAEIKKINNKLSQLL